MVRFWLFLLLGLIGSLPSLRAASVWKVISPNGGLFYLAGSIHALKSTDYPLPQEYNRAFDASSHLIFEIDPKDSLGRDLEKAGQYSHGDSMKNHVDPRTYDYLKRLFAMMNVPEATFAKYRPWFLNLMLGSVAAQHNGISQSLGVEVFLNRRARATNKSTGGLESIREHVDVLAGFTDKQSEAMLLLSMIPHAEGSELANQMTRAWRTGDADALNALELKTMSDFPSIGDRLLAMRNRRWIPKLERFAQSKEPYFVVVGGAHLGGNDGLLNLLRQRGYRAEKI